MLATAACVVPDARMPLRHAWCFLSPMKEVTVMSTSPNPRPNFLAPMTAHPIEHAEETVDEPHEDELVGATPHLSSEDRRPEEPSEEAAGITDLG